MAETKDMKEHDRIIVESVSLLREDFRGGDRKSIADKNLNLTEDDVYDLFSLALTAGKRRLVQKFLDIGIIVQKFHVDSLFENPMGLSPSRCSRLFHQIAPYYFSSDHEWTGIELELSSDSDVYRKYDDIAKAYIEESEEATETSVSEEDSEGSEGSDSEEEEGSLSDETRETGETEVSDDVDEPGETVETEASELEEEEEEDEDDEDDAEEQQLVI